MPGHADDELNARDAAAPSEAPTDAPSLAAALRALPDATPPDLWATLARELAPPRASRQRRARRILIAAAAVLAIGIATGYVARTTLRAPRTNVAQTTASAAVPVPDAAAAPSAAELARVRNQSQTLERWLAAVAARSPQSSGASMAAVEIEDLIGLVDVQLTAARDADEALPLWRQRVSLLEDLAAIRGQAFSLAETGTGADGSATAPYPMVN